jgi:hypothetical protein
MNRPERDDRHQSEEFFELHRALVKDFLMATGERVSEDTLVESYENPSYEEAASRIYRFREDISIADFGAAVKAWGRKRGYFYPSLSDLLRHEGIFVRLTDDAIVVVSIHRFRHIYPVKMDNSLMYVDRGVLSG